MRKWYSGLLTAGLITAAGLAIGAVNSADADASVFAASGEASGNAEAIANSLDMYGSKIEIDILGDVEDVLVGAAKVSKAGVVTIPTWDVYSNTEFDYVDGARLYVDVSKMVNAKKDSYIAIKANGESDADALLIKINKAGDDFVLKTKAKVDKTTGNVEVSYSEGKKGSFTQLDASGDAVGLIPGKPDRIGLASSDANLRVQVHSSELVDIDSAKKAVLGENFNQEMMTGATYYINGIVDASYKPAASTVSNKLVETKYSVGGKDIICYSNDTWKSKPKEKFSSAKVVIPKRANGPKLKVNYVKGTVTIPKDANYRFMSLPKGDAKKVVFASWNATAESAAKEIDVTKVSFEAANAKGSISLKEDPFAVDLRLEKANKLASKISHTVLPAMKTIALASKDAKIASYNAYGTGFKAVSGEALTLKYSVDSKTKKYVLTAKNDSSDKAVVYAVTYGSSAAKKVPATGKEIKITADSANNTTVKISKLGVSKKGSESWATNELELTTDNTSGDANKN